MDHLRSYLWQARLPLMHIRWRHLLACQSHASRRNQFLQLQQRRLVIPGETGSLVSGHADE